MVKESQPIKIYKPIVSIAMMAVLQITNAERKGKHDFRSRRRNLPNIPRFV